MSRHLRLRLAKLPKAVQDISWKAQVRLCTRYRTLRARGQHANQVVVAIARELIACMWAIAKEVPVLPSKAHIVLEQSSKACDRKGRGPGMV
jgi:transposase